MSKKFTNRHAEEARQRDMAREESSRSQKQKAKEDAEWADNDKSTLKRQEKQREEDRKAAERAEREAEKRTQLSQEASEAANKAPPHVQKRMRQKEVNAMLSNYRQDGGGGGGGGGADSGVSEQPDLPKENPNKQRGVQSGAPQSDTITASGSAGQVLDSVERQKVAGGAATSVPDNRHIGKRARVLYKAFCAENTEAVRADHPNLRRTQYNDVLWEMWQKSPQNPFVRRSEAQNQARLEEERRWMEGGSSGDEDEEGEEADA